MRREEGTSERGSQKLRKEGGERGTKKGDLKPVPRKRSPLPKAKSEEEKKEVRNRKDSEKKKSRIGKKEFKIQLPGEKEGKSQWDSKCPEKHRKLFHRVPKAEERRGY